VTGGTPAFTVLTAVNTQNATVGFPVKVTSSITYSGTYPSGSGFRLALFSYTINWGDGTSSVVQNTGFIPPYPASTTHNYTAAASYPITVIARSSQTPQIGETGSASVSVASVVTGDFSLSATSIAAGQSVSFTSTISGGVPPYTYFWNYGDGSTDTGASTTHTFTNSGNYNVTVMVTDSGARKFSKTHIVTVSAAPPPPPPLLNNSLLIYAGVAAAAVAAIASLLFLRKRRARRALHT
jgi:PKD repeat protein